MIAVRKRQSLIDIKLLVANDAREFVDTKEQNDEVGLSVVLYKYSMRVDMNENQKYSRQALLLDPQRDPGASTSKRPTLTLRWAGKTAPVPDIMFVEEVIATAPMCGLPSIREMSTPCPWSEQDPVDLCLELWKRWMAGDSDRDLGTKTMRGLLGDDARDLDLYEAQQVSDARIAEATGAMIDSLNRIHVWAIYRACGVAVVWRFPNASLMDVAAEARAELRIKLRGNIATGLLFS